MMRDVSDSTRLCEEALASSVGPLREKAVQIVSLDSSRCLKSLRNLPVEQVETILRSWKSQLIAALEREYGTVRLEVGNSSGNRSKSDLLAYLSSGQIVLVETKFGFSTTTAAGIKRVSEVLTVPCFALDANQKLTIIRRREAPMNAKQYLESVMTAYAECFNAEPPTPNSSKIYDLVKSSGAEGNSKDTSDYRVFNFGYDGVAVSLTESPLSLTHNDVWTVQCVVSSASEKKGARLAFMFQSMDGTKNLKLLHNNKNTNYVDSNGLRIDKTKYEHEFFAVPSYLQSGAGSYNGWYSEHSDIEDE